MHPHSKISYWQFLNLGMFFSSINKQTACAYHLYTTDNYNWEAKDSSALTPMGFIIC